MTLDEAIKKFINLQKKPREKGHYWASEIYKIKKGYLKPQDFYKRKEITEERAIANICQGIAGEDFLSRVFKETEVPFTSQVRFEIEVSPGIFLSGRPDFDFGQSIFEVKAPVSQLDEIPIRYVDQLEAYVRAYGLKKDVYLCELRFYPFTPIIWPYTPNEELWRETVDALIAFDKKVPQKNG